MRYRNILGSLVIITTSMLLVACFEPTTEEIQKAAEEKVLSLLRTQDYGLLSDKDKAAGTREDLQTLDPWGAPEVFSGEGDKYYELEKFLADQSGYQILSSSYDPETKITTVTAEWVVPTLYSELIVNEDGVYETDKSSRVLQRFESGVLTEENIKKEHFELPSFKVDNTGVYIGLETMLAIRDVWEEVSDEARLLRGLGFRSKTTLEELAQLDAIHQALDTVEEAAKEIQQLDPNQKEPFSLALSMGTDTLAEIQLLQKTLDVVSFSEPTITDYRIGGVGMDTTLRVSEPVPVRILYCLIEYYDGEQKIGEENSVCGQDLHKNLVQERGRPLENEIAAKEASRIRIQVTGISPIRDFQESTL